MMLPQITAVAESIRQCLTRIHVHRAANDGSKVMDELISVQHDVVGALETLTVFCDNLAKGMRGSHKSLPECKSIMNLKVLGSNKSDFKSWNEKFVNAVTQGAGTPWRRFLMSLNKQLDQDRRVLTPSELGNVDGVSHIVNYQDVDEGLYFVLVDKTEGEAALRVNSGEPGEGVQAYMRVYLWFAGTTGLALTEKTRLIMHPTPAKHDHEIADLLERWSEQERPRSN